RLQRSGCLGVRRLARRGAPALVPPICGRAGTPRRAAPRGRQCGGGVRHGAARAGAGLAARNRGPVRAADTRTRRRPGRGAGPVQGVRVATEARFGRGAGRRDSRARRVGAAVRAVAADQGDPWSGVFGIARGGLLDAPGVAGAPPAALAQLRGTAPTGAPGRALAEVVQAVADEQPVVVFVDDAHCLDQESLLALGGAMRELARSPVAFLMTVALHPAAPGVDEVRA